MKPYYVRTSATVVEVSSGYRIQFDGMERYNWQKTFKAQMNDALVRMALPNQPFAGYYDTTNRAVSDVENSLFTNMAGSLPTAITLLRFERGSYAPPEPPTPIALVDGHLPITATPWVAIGPIGRRQGRRPPSPRSSPIVVGWLRWTGLVSLRHGRADGCVNLTGQTWGLTRTSDCDWSCMQPDKDLAMRSRLARI
jgi:hypothetical protein